MQNFDRQYRLTAGQNGAVGFEIGSGDRPLHISFSIEKVDNATSNTAKVSIWNLNDEHIAELNKEDCVVTLYAGYGNSLPLIFTGTVYFVKTKMDGADLCTEVELYDDAASLNDTYTSVSYTESVSVKKVIEDVADQMGVAVKYADSAVFTDLPSGFSYVGSASDTLNKACDSSSLTWSIQNGVMHVKLSGSTMSTDCYVLSADTGLIGMPEKVLVTNDSSGREYGYDVQYFMNAAIGVDDYVYLQSRYVTGYYTVYSVAIEGDNVEGDWTCSARLLEPIS